MWDIHRRSATCFARHAARVPASRPRHRDHARRRLLLEPLETRALLSLTTWTVNSLGDTGYGSGQSGDLRYCITQADKTTGDNTINFSVTGTITLNSALPDLSNTTGLMDIEGPGASSLTVARNSAEGTPDFGVFTVDAGVQAQLASLTIAGGSGNSGEDGGGINNSGALTGIYNLLRNLGGSFGIAVVTTLLARRAQFHQSRLVEHLTAGSPAFSAWQHRMAEILPGLGPHWHYWEAPRAMAALYDQVQAQAMTLSYNDGYWFFTVLFLLLVPLVFMMRRPRIPQEEIIKGG